MPTTAHDMPGAMSELVPQILSVHLGGWSGFGEGAVRFDLGWERTVLVGKNAAGKSVVLEALFDGARTALQRNVRPRERIVTFQCEIGTPGDVQLIYEYSLAPATVDDDGEGDDVSSPGVAMRRASWSEQCRRASGEVVWRVQSGDLMLGGAPRPFPEGLSLLSMLNAFEPVPPEAGLVRSRLAAVELVRAGVPRNLEGIRRSLTLVKREGEDKAWQPFSARPDRVDRLALRLANLMRASEQDFGELNELVRRLGLGQEIAVAPFKMQDETLGWVALDGCNLGLLSDGTLRVIEILTVVLTRTRAVICIEEPETGIHPGLLDRLLAVLRSYSTDRQIVVSTHSPYVVRWCEPADVRLVERTTEGTTVRAFHPEELDGIDAYLRDEGTLDSLLFEHTSDEGEEEGGG